MTKKEIVHYKCDGCGMEDHNVLEDNTLPLDWLEINFLREEGEDRHFCSPCRMALLTHARIQTVSTEDIKAVRDFGREHG